MEHKLISTVINQFIFLAVCIPFYSCIIYTYKVMGFSVLLHETTISILIEYLSAWKPENTVLLFV